MKLFRKVSLLFFAFLLIVPIISLTMQFALAQDTAKAVDTLLADTIKEAARLLPAKVYVLKIDGAIGAVTDERVEQAIELAEDEGAEREPGHKDHEHRGYRELGRAEGENQQPYPDQLVGEPGQTGQEEEAEYQVV